MVQCSQTNRLVGKVQVRNEEKIYYEKPTQGYLYTYKIATQANAHMAFIPAAVMLFLQAWSNHDTTSDGKSARASSSILTKTWPSIGSCTNPQPRRPR